MESSAQTIRKASSASWLAWSLVALYMVSIAASLALMAITGSTAMGGVPLAYFYLEAIILVVWSVVGALIVSRQPRHPVGWIWCLLPFLIVLDNLAMGYAYYGLVTHPGSLPGVNLATGWLLGVFARGTLGPLAFTLLFLLFPTGRFLSRGWKVLGWITAGTVLTIILTKIMAPNSNPVPEIPISLELYGLRGAARAAAGQMYQITNVLLLVCILAAVASLFARLYRARGVERQQLKWFVYAAIFIAIGNALSSMAEGQDAPGLKSIFLIGIALVGLGAAGVAIASAIAIFRYRLWDIDLIIHRTLVYSILTATLSLVYLSSVVLLQELSRLITRQSQPPVVTVLSTLAIIALFHPFRRRIQTFIDRRFYRKTYNAERVLAAFSTSLREEVDLDHLMNSILDVVKDTMQPEHLSVWLRKDELQPKG